MAGQRFTRTIPVRTDAAGAATAYFDGLGQDVVIDSVQVSTLTNAKEPTAKVYLDNVTLLGGTSLGSYDTSSSQVGMSAGRTLSCIWAGADANTIATLQLSGTQYPPGEGPHITGGTIIFNRTLVGAAQFGEKTAVVDSLSTTLNGGTGTSGPVVDVRAWASFYLTVTGTRSGAATAYNPIAVRLVWFADAAGTQVIYSDTYEILAFRSAAPFATLGGRLVGQDTIHGPWMQIFINNIGPDQCAASYQLVGTTRPFPGPYYKETQQDLPPDIYNPDQFVVTPAGGTVVGLPVGTNVTFPGLLRYGRAKWRVSCSQPFTAVFTAGSAGDFDSTTAAAPAINTGEFILPKRSLLVTVYNNGAGVMDILLNVITESQKF